MSALKVDFFVIGVARGGTTSLYHYLQQHPDIFLPKVKECNFFSEVESMDESVYEDPKPGKEYHMKIIRSPKVYQSLYSEARLDQLKGEISPAYVWDAGSAQKILQHNPEARLIVSLRNPIERAFSHYLMHFQTGYEKAPTFEEALKAPKREIWGGGNQYLEMGLYFEQLKAYFDLFPPEHIKVLVSEEWTRNNGEALNEIYGFLGLGAISHQDLEATHNASVQLKNKGLLDLLRSQKIKRSINKVLPQKTKEKLMEQLFHKEAEKQEMLEETYNSLRSFFAEDIRQTEQLIGQHLNTFWNIY